jgi:hypothetical protein
MKSSTSPTWEDRSSSEQIDIIVEGLADWRGKTLSQLRALIKKAEPGLVEEVKWKKPSNPKGVPVWSHDGIICIGDALKNAVRLTFPRGAQLKDPFRVGSDSIPVLQGSWCRGIRLGPISNTCWFS